MEAMEDLTKSLENYVRYEEYRFLENDCKVMVKHEDLDGISLRMDAMEKRAAQFLKQDEFMHRINIFQSDVKDQLALRPTEKQIKQTIKHLDDKINQDSNEVNARMDTFAKMQSSFDNELKMHGSDIDKLTHRLDKDNLNKDDGKRIWRHFQRFAEYNDLKELYTKCIP